jgi:uracil-DNA glycosylase family 4
MKGFFNKEDTRSLSITQSKKLSCFSCGLHRHVNSPKIKPWGKFEKQIMIIGKSPSKRDDQTGELWQGRDGRLLKRTLRKFNIDLFQDCISINSVNCLITKQNPTAKEIECCRDVKVLKAIIEYKPKIILILGVDALTSFIGHRWKKSLGGINKWRGWSIPDQDYKTWVCPAFHPDYVLSMKLPEVTVTWEQDLEQAFRSYQSEGDHFPLYEKPNIHYIDDLEVLNTIDSEMVAFDYEDTGLKPQAAGHRIVCASVALDHNNVCTFLMPKKKRLREPFLKLLKNRKIKKIAANLKHEDHWSKIRLKTEVKGWVFDTMLAAHILDNRAGITSLKFQAYVQLGIINYDEEIAPYLKPTHSVKKENGGNAINQIHKLIDQPDGVKDLLKYCALDSIYEYRIAQIQMNKLELMSLPF